MNIQVKTNDQYFNVVLFIVLYKVVLTFESVDGILQWDHSNTVKPPVSGHPWGQAQLSAYRRLINTNTIGGRV